MTIAHREKVNHLIWWLLWASLGCRLLLQAVDLLSSFDPNRFAFSELLINFQGGFVRRGLLGEVAYRFTALTGISPKWPLLIVCYAVYAYVVWFFLRKFKQRNYCRWLVLAPVFCGFVAYVVRKDFMLYALLAGIFTLLAPPGENEPNLWRRTTATLLCILALWLHEAFLFWGVPLTALALISYKKGRIAGIFMILAILASFALLSLYKGDTATAHSIVDSWNEVWPGSPISIPAGNLSSIGALAWSTTDTFKHHLLVNFYQGDSFICFFIWAFIMLAVYYMLTNFLSVFRSPSSDYDDRQRDRLSTMLIIEGICMLPMFTVLSCDYGRLVQHITVATFGALVILPPSRLQAMLPCSWVALTARLNRGMNTLLHPSRGLLALMLLFIGISPMHYNLENCFRESVVGTFCNLAAKLLKGLYLYLQ